MEQTNKKFKPDFSDEIIVGVSEFLNPHTPIIPGILKYKITDFIVNEIDLTGKIAFATDKPESLFEPQIKVQLRN